MRINLKVNPEYVVNINFLFDEFDLNGEFYGKFDVYVDFEIVNFSIKI